MANFRNVVALVIAGTLLTACVNDARDAWETESSATMTAYEAYKPPTLIPTPTSTTDPRSELQAILGSVCTGQPLSQAAPYTGGPPHPLVVSAADGSPHPWTTLVVDSMMPPSPADTQLVACVSQDHIRLRSCSYTGGVTLTQYRYDTRVALMEAQTGILLAESTFQGSGATECPVSVVTSGETKLEWYGHEVPYTEVETWLAGFVQATNTALLKLDAASLLIDDFEDPAQVTLTEIEEGETVRHCYVANREGVGLPPEMVHTGSFDMDIFAPGDGWAGCKRVLSEGNITDWSDSQGIAFWYSGGENQNVFFWIVAGDPARVYSVSFRTLSEGGGVWHRAGFAWDEFTLAPWEDDGEAPPLDLSNVTAYGFSIGSISVNNMLLSVDDIALILE